METVGSVLALRVADPTEALIDYVAVDGASSDGSLDALEQLEPPPWVRLRVVSEPDAGIYDAVWKGLQLVEGDWYGWLGAGDLLSPSCHRALTLVHDCVPEAEWVTGISVLYATNGDLITARIPQRYLSSMLRSGLYGRSALPFVQQESTFWNGRLMRTVPEEFRGFNLAGDLWLWKHFAEVLDGERFPLAVVRAHLGGFRSHPAHHIGDLDAYLAEADRIVGRVGWLQRLRGRFEASRWAVHLEPMNRRRQRTIAIALDHSRAHMHRPSRSAKWSKRARQRMFAASPAWVIRTVRALRGSATDGPGPVGGRRVVLAGPTLVSG